MTENNNNEKSETGLPLEEEKIEKMAQEDSQHFFSMDPVFSQKAASIILSETDQLAAKYPEKIQAFREKM